MARMDWQVHATVRIPQQLTDAQIDAIAEDLARSNQGTLAIHPDDPQILEATMTGHPLIHREGDDAVAYAIAGALAQLRYALEDSGVTFEVVDTDARRFEVA